MPAVLGYRDLVSRAVSTACKVVTGKEGTSESVSDEAVTELVSAVGEAFNNAVKHAYAGQEPGEVTVEIRAEGGVVEVAMGDEGQSFELETVPEPDLAALPESGMGLFIIRAFCDEVTYTAGKPNVLRMRKRL